MDIRPAVPEDREGLAKLLDRIENFSPDEVRCALEVIDLALQPSNPDYQIMRQRLGLANALLRPRQLLLLDEPTNGMFHYKRNGITAFTAPKTFKYLF